MNWELYMGNGDPLWICFPHYFAMVSACFVCMSIHDGSKFEIIFL